jgi:hypothetical protein
MIRQQRRFLTRGFQKEIEKLEKISERMDKIRNDKNTDDVDKIQSGIMTKITLLQTKINQLNDVRREEDTTEQNPRQEGDNKERQD